MAPLPDPSPAGPNPPNTTRWAFIAAVLVVLAGLGAAALVLVNQSGTTTANDGNARPEFVVTQAVAAQPEFQPVFEEGDDPFFPIGAQLIAFEEETGEQVSDEIFQTGLFGGTVAQTCDSDRLIAYLYENPTKAEAWAAAQAIPFNEIASYIRSLDARVLAASAVVINNGFDQLTGAPIPVETTLDTSSASPASSRRTRCRAPRFPSPTEPVLAGSRTSTPESPRPIAPRSYSRLGLNANVSATAPSGQTQPAVTSKAAWHKCLVAS